MRNYKCDNYDTCLDIAAKGNFSFSCTKCDGKTIIIKKGNAMKPGRKAGKNLEVKKEERKTVQICIKFGERYIAIYQDLVKVAEDENRTIGMQAMYFIKKGIGTYKQLEKE